MPVVCPFALGGMSSSASSAAGAPTTGGRVTAAWALLPACAVAGLAGVGITVHSVEELSELFGRDGDVEILMDQLDPSGSLGRALFAEVLLELRCSAGGPAGTKRRRRASYGFSVPCPLLRTQSQVN